MRHSGFLQRAEDGSMSSPTPVKFQEIQNHLMTCPISRIHFADENGNLRTDTTTIEQMKTLSQSTRSALFQAWSELRFIVSHYESELYKGWLQMSPLQRKRLLAKICPEMPETHRPDLALLREADRTGSAIGTMSKFVMRFPYLNLQDLSKQGPLLWMLDSRSRNFPSIFASADWNFIRLGLKTKTITPHYLRGYTMYLNGEWTENTYGRVVPWEVDRSAILKYHHGVAPDPGMGLTILETQRDLLIFLVRSSISILDDVLEIAITKWSLESISSSSTAQILLQQDDSMSPKSSVADYQSPALRALEEPYHVPHTFDLQRTRALVDAKSREAQDNLILLREDPGFFRDVVLDACTDTIEALVKQDFEPSYHSLMKGTRHEAVALALIRLYQQALLWEVICRLFDDMIAIHKNLGDHIQPGELLPAPFMEALSRLEYCLDDVITVWIGRLSLFICLTPAFKQYITHGPVKGGPKGRYMTNLRKHPSTLLDDVFRSTKLYHKPNR